MKGVSACILCELVLPGKLQTSLCLNNLCSAFGPSTVIGTGNGNTSEIPSHTSDRLKSRGGTAES